GSMLSRSYIKFAPEGCFLVTAPQAADSIHYKIFTCTSVRQNVTFLITLVCKNAMLHFPTFIQQVEMPLKRHRSCQWFGNAKPLEDCFGVKNR
ncbi:MAG: hypothetical protein ACT6FF_04835, partial [Methanosarcinaceae archaeon]